MDSTPTPQKRQTPSPQALAIVAKLRKLLAQREALKAKGAK